MNASSADLAAVATILETIASDPLAGAARLEEMALGLLALAGRLRASPAPAEGFVSQGGMMDRVKMCVVGPDGTTKQKIDTGAQS